VKRRARRIPAAIAGAVATAGFAASCSLGDGTGAVKSASLNAPDCWEGEYDLKPDFFAAQPYQNAVYIRVQRGSDQQGVSDGILILVDDVTDAIENHLGQPMDVTLPEGVAPPGVVPGSLCGDSCSDKGVHLTFYLLHSCFNENMVLYGVSGTITFDHLFNGNQNESDAAKKLTEGEFDVMVGDPQDIVTSGPDKGTIPGQSELTGRFRFYFQRGQPAQPFP
jgi:hypothetical protein